MSRPLMVPPDVKKRIEAALDLLRKSAGQLSLFDESKVSRHAKGPKGGQFAPKGGDQESKPASPYADELADLQAKLAEVNKKREKHDAMSQAWRDANFPPGLQTDPGGIHSRSSRKIAQLENKQFQIAREGVALATEGGRLESQIDAIESGRREKHDEQKAKRKATTPLKRLEEAAYVMFATKPEPGSDEHNEWLEALADAKHKQLIKQWEAAVERGRKKAQKEGHI